MIDVGKLTEIQTEALFAQCIDNLPEEALIRILSEKLTLTQAEEVVAIITP